MANDDKDHEFRRSADFVAMARVFIGICGAIAIAIPIASYSTSCAIWASAIGLSMAILVASGLTGGLIGFIFSVPYVNKVTRVVHSDAAPAAVDGQPKDVVEQREPLLKSNSNLEKISEWLTTMLVGVGLSQINYVFQGLSEFGRFLAPMDVILVPPNDMVVGRMRYLGPPILVAGVTLGFLGVYLYTRLRISYLFHHVERELEGVPAVNAKLTVAESRKLTSIVETSNIKDTASIKVMASANRASVRDALSAMTQLLYDVKNDGFLKAIKMGNELLSTPAVSVARFWFLMAAASGQHYTDKLKKGALPEVLQPIREDVLYYIDKTLDLDKSYSRTFLKMLDKNSYDNDLKSFADDEEVLRRLRES